MYMYIQMYIQSIAHTKSVNLPRNVIDLCNLYVSKLKVTEIDTACR